MTLVGALILLVIGIVVLVATRSYVTEPVLRIIGLCIGGICVIVGGIYLLIAILHLVGIGGPALTNTP
jgi:hypothetical protein